MRSPRLTIELPSWVDGLVDWQRRYPRPEDRMALVIAVGHEQIRRATGGPFAAAVFERDSGVLVAVGVNLAVPSHNCVLHAEVVALMMAGAQLHSHSLGAEGMPQHELVSSCEPCAMCLGAVFWSGAASLVTGATKGDAEAVGYNEGPVFPESYAHLERKGMTVVREIMREEARALFAAYQAAGGEIY
ncbi:MAG: nucleoside deaminase [Gemmatimonadales bacterium]|jgi:tRNA(Arg) A34 adenosine deaminase TadA|nr:MAG: nucleoside deaminase [Gemmatimonadales bacterium]